MNSVLSIESITNLALKLVLVFPEWKKAKGNVFCLCDNIDSAFVTFINRVHERCVFLFKGLE